MDFEELVAIDKWLVKTAVEHYEIEDKSNLDEDMLYTMALDGFHYACDKYEKQHPSVKEEDTSDEVWSDIFLDNDILSEIMICLTK